MEETVCGNIQKESRNCGRAGRGTLNLGGGREQEGAALKSEGRNPHLAQPEPTREESNRGIRGIRGKGLLVVLGFRVFRVFRGSRSQPSWIQLYGDEAKAEIRRPRSQSSRAFALHSTLRPQALPCHAATAPNEGPDADFGFRISDFLRISGLRISDFPPGLGLRPSDFGFRPSAAAFAWSQYCLSMAQLPMGIWSPGWPSELMS